ncbi:MAG: hypothetical protein AMS26_12580 [Bacteroides sp. SM23_62]|nr:MAG: hypothetical protein AMS26_12580 [Bacteroides sp. SM23_62]
MKKILYLFLILAGCASPRGEIREMISLAGEWKFRLDTLDLGLTQKWYTGSFNEHVNLPGSMAENGKGNKVRVSTEWTGNIWDSSYFTDDRYRKYRQADHIKIPFWLKPVKYYVGPAWYQKEIRLPDDWRGRRVVLSLERCHWESRLFVNDRVAVTLDKPFEDSFDGIVEIGASPFNTENTHRPGRLSKELAFNGPSQTFEMEYPMGERVQLWSEFSPALYRLS